MSCRQDKERENAAALEVLPDLLKELDGTPPRARLTALIEGVLAANIFDWGAKACVDLYHNGTILEIYRCALVSCTQGLQAEHGLLAEDFFIFHFSTVKGTLLQATEEEHLGRQPQRSMCAACFKL